jgi:hypothetical protein
VARGFAGVLRRPIEIVTQSGRSGLAGNDADHPHSVLLFLFAAALLGVRKQPCTM